MFHFTEYSEDQAQIWDGFIAEKSINGTFLQSRRFFQYHPAGRFQDASILIWDDKGSLTALCPGCTIEKNGKKTFFSHKGSTFGGIIVDKKHYSAMYVLPLLEELESYLSSKGYDECYLKMTSAIFSTENDALFQFAFQYRGFTEYKELSTYVDFQDYSGEVIDHLAEMKRRNVRKNEKQGAVLKVLTEDSQIADFYDILCENLLKYDTKPVHTLEELLDFKNSRFQKECEFLGVYIGEEMAAGTMMFYFDKAGTAHTQYLAQKNSYTKLSPMAYLYYAVLVEMRKRGFRRVSWGIATEDLGQVVNIGLLTNKEMFGSTYCNNLTYFKALSR